MSGDLRRHRAGLERDNDFYRRTGRSDGDAAALLKIIGAGSEWERAEVVGGIFREYVESGVYNCDGEFGDPKAMWRITSRGTEALDAWGDHLGYAVPDNECEIEVALRRMRAVIADPASAIASLRAAGLVPEPLSDAAVAYMLDSDHATWEREARRVMVQHGMARRRRARA